MGVYNAANIRLDRIHVLEDEVETPLSDQKVAVVTELELQKLIDEYTVAEESYCRIVMDRKDIFCKQ